MVVSKSVAKRFLTEKMKTW